MKRENAETTLEGYRKALLHRNAELLVALTAYASGLRIRGLGSKCLRSPEASGTMGGSFRMKASHGSSVRCTVIGCLVSLVLTLTVVLPVLAQEPTEMLYKQKCASCHATHGTGDTRKGKKTGARDFGSADVQNETDAEFIEIIANGKNKMPGYKKRLTDTQIKDLAAHCRAMGKKK